MVKKSWYHKAIRRDENFEYSGPTGLLVGCSRAFRVDLSLSTTILIEKERTARGISNLSPGANCHSHRYDFRIWLLFLRHMERHVPSIGSIHTCLERKSETPLMPGQSIVQTGNRSS